jgi:hypothetical protein
LIAIRLLPAIYFLTLLLSDLAIYITESLFGMYALTFRPFIYALLMLFVLQALSHKKSNLFNKYFWHGVKGTEPSRVIYFWLSVIIGVFGSACLVSGLITVMIGSQSSFSMTNVRDDIFYLAVAAVLLSPIMMTWRIYIDSHKANL